MAFDSAPILSTPAEHILDIPSAASIPTQTRLPDELLFIQYEVQRTVDEIRRGRWRRIALQFPDEMLVDAPRVYEALRDRLNSPSKHNRLSSNHDDDLDAAPRQTQHLGLSSEGGSVAGEDDIMTKLTILADTSYGACCVDEVAAEHIDADAVVHYGRSCLSPTSRLPVIYIFTARPLTLDAVHESFTKTYPDKHEKICLMADIPFNHHLDDLQLRLSEEGYSSIFKTSIVHNPSSLLPNRTVPKEVEENADALKDYSVFHLANPPTSLLLVLSSRIKSMHIYSNDESTSTVTEASTSQLLRRRYALLTRLSTVPVFGILINTLSVSNYITALQHCQDLILRAGKKSYVFVVGKVNAAKVANFSEIGGWVVIGCWESSLIESKDFYRPIITPFELEVALTDDNERTWGGQWIADFSAVLRQSSEKPASGGAMNRDEPQEEETKASGNWDEQSSDDEPPEFDLRTGKYVSHSRPMGRVKQSAAINQTTSGSSDIKAPPSSALVQRAKGDVASIRGQVSPAAEFLRSKRTWQGLGSDHEVAYERNEDGTIRGATMEAGRGGVAKGYKAEGVGSSSK